jgi:THO complex subunit 1
VKAMEADPPANPSDEDKRPLGEKIRSVTWRGYRLGCKEKLGSYDKPALPEEKRLKGSEASTGDDSAPTEPVDRDPAPQAEHPSVEDQRPDQQDQMTAATAAEVQQA